MPALADLYRNGVLPEDESVLEPCAGGDGMIANRTDELPGSSGGRSCMGDGGPDRADPGHLAAVLCPVVDSAGRAGHTPGRGSPVRQPLGECIMKRYAALARVSSREQEREGFSLDVQEEALNRYAERHGGKIVQLYRIAETASKQAERKTFKELLAYAREACGGAGGRLVLQGRSCGAEYLRLRGA